jgi:hypothetical protein
MAEEIWSPGKTFGAVFTLVLTSVVAVNFYHVIVQSAREKKDGILRNSKKNNLNSDVHISLQKKCFPI